MLLAGASLGQACSVEYISSKMRFIGFPSMKGVKGAAETPVHFKPQAMRSLL